MKRKRWIYIIPAAIAGIILFTFLGGEVVKALWNWLLPSLFGARQITFWQAVGLLALCRILVGGFGLHGGRSGMRRRLTAEERERFREGMRGRCEVSPAE